MSSHYTSPYKERPSVPIRRTPLQVFPDSTLRKRTTSTPLLLDQCAGEPTLYDMLQEATLPQLFKVVNGYHCYGEDDYFTKGDIYLCEALLKTKVLKALDNDRKIHSIPSNSSLHFALLGENFDYSSYSNSTLDKVSDLVSLPMLPTSVKATKRHHTSADKSLFDKEDILFPLYVKSKPGGLRHRRILTLATPEGKEIELSMDVRGGFTVDPQSNLLPIDKVWKHISRNLPQKLLVVFGGDKMPEMVTCSEVCEEVTCVVRKVSNEVAMEPSLELPITLPLPVEPVEAEPGFKTSKFLVTNITRRCSSVSTSGLQHKLYSHVNYTVGHCTVLKSLTGGHSNSARPSTPPVVPTPVDSLKNMRSQLAGERHKDQSKYSTLPGWAKLTAGPERLALPQWKSESDGYAEIQPLYSNTGGLASEGGAGVVPSASLSDLPLPSLGSSSTSCKEDTADQYVDMKKYMSNIVGNRETKPMPFATPIPRSATTPTSEGNIEFALQRLKTENSKLKGKVSRLEKELELLRRQPTAVGMSHHVITPPSPHPQSQSQEEKEAQKERNISYINSLDEDQVIDLLVAVNLSDYVTLFRKEAIDGTLLLGLNEEDLQQIGVTNTFHVKKLLMLIDGRVSAYAKLTRFASRSN